jgi:hypothetical protein
LGIAIGVPALAIVSFVGGFVVWHLRRRGSKTKGENTREVAELPQETAPRE